MYLHHGLVTIPVVTSQPDKRPTSRARSVALLDEVVEHAQDRRRDGALLVVAALGRDDRRPLAEFRAPPARPTAARGGPSSAGRARARRPPPPRSRRGPRLPHPGAAARAAAPPP